MRIRTGRREFLYGAVSAASLLALRSAAASDSTADAWQRAADIARNVRPPTFPDRVFDITKHGAIPDGATLNTSAIARAIDACANTGGGRVLVPELEKLATLRDQGILTEEEFQSLKKRLLSNIEA